MQDLQEIKHRFKQLNQLHEQRALEALLPHQQVFLDILPLLFQCNFPMLPGFISSETPAGIHGYKPSNQTLNAAKKLALDFNYTRTASQTYPIDGLYIMGSANSIAFSKTCEIDVWLCYQSNLLVSAFEELLKKTTAIEIWAASLELEAHFFLIDSKNFRCGENTPISKRSGSLIQHHLSLEEFYRTGIYIAGKIPAWWLVPPHEEGNYSRYVKHLIDNRFINEHELIDFGGLESVPADEFINATLWSLYKALQSPRKSLLNLLLMECYVSEYPQVEWLCSEVKNAVYQGSFMLADLEPYFLIYQKVEKYLQQKQGTERSDLVKQSFYLTIMGLLEQAMDAPIRASRNKYMQNIAEQQKWPASIINNLKRPQFWDIKKAVSEHLVILQQLTQCYRMIMAFARGHAAKNQENTENQKLITRKLQSFLEKKPGKIEIITTYAEVNSKENAVSVVENNLASGNSEWAIYSKFVQAATAVNFEPIQKCRTMIEVLFWLALNGLYHKNLQISLSSHSTTMPDEELYSIMRQINLFLTQNFNFDTPLEAYQTAKNTLNSLVIINMGIPDNERLYVISDRSDPFSYGLDRQCFVQATTRISLSSWGEVTTFQDEGLAGLFNCFTDIINTNNKPLSLKNMKVLCHTPKRARDIIFRIEVVFSILVKLFSIQQDNSSPRYILPGGLSFYVFQVNNKALGYKELATEQLLINELSRPQELFSTVHFDKAVLENTPIALVYSLNKPQVVQLFYYDNNMDTCIYIVDEKGSLHIQQHNKASASHIVKQYAALLESIINRNQLEKIMHIEYYSIEKSSADTFSCKKLQLKEIPSNKALSLRIAGEDTPIGIVYTIFCNEKEFSSLDFGNKVFHAAYQYILQIRDDKINYPIYITDIDLPLSAFRIDNPKLLQTIHYLKYKQKIEDKFNNEAQ